MANPLYNVLNGAQSVGAQQGITNPFQMLNALRTNPSAILRARGLNVPDGMNNPQDIINHLLQSGQVPQSRYAQVLQNMQHLKK